MVVRGLESRNNGCGSGPGYAMASSAVSSTSSDRMRMGAAGLASSVQPAALAARANSADSSPVSSTAGTGAPSAVRSPSMPRSPSVPPGRR